VSFVAFPGANRGGANHDESRMNEPTRSWCSRTACRIRAFTE